MYIIPGVGFVSTSFDGEVYIENSVAASILSCVYAFSPVLETLLDKLSQQHPPDKIVGTVQSLIANKYLRIMDDSAEAENKQSDLGLARLKSRLRRLYALPKKHVDFTFSFSFFESVLLCPCREAHIDVNVSANVVLLGPLSGFDGSVCGSCFKARLLSHRPILKFVEAHRDSLQYIGSSTSVGFLPSRLYSVFKQRSENLDPKLFWHVDLTTGTFSGYAVISLGECLSCNCRAENKSVSMIDEIKNLGGSRSLGYRTKSLDETYKSVAHLVNPYVGLISELKPYKPLGSDLICNYSSGRNLAMVSSNKFWLNNHIRSSSGGKGKTPLQAKVGSLCEAVERYSMVHQGQAPSVVASFEGLGELAIDPRLCLNYSDSQFERRDEINRSTFSFHQLIPTKFNTHERVDWSEAYSLSQGKTRYVLSEICYAQYKGRDEDVIYAFPDSNGCAAGNTYLEAVLQGALELIERDSAAIWWYNKCECAHINIASIGSEYIRKISQYYRSLGRAFYILDISSDISVPCFVALTYHLHNKNQILYGFGCHVDPHIAIERCVIELNQLLPLAQKPGRKKVDEAIFNWMETETIGNHAYLNTALNREIEFSSIAEKYKVLSIGSAIEHIVERLRCQGIELIAFDLGQKDTGMPVVKMIAPGLRHFWRRTGPGRLYHVPVKLGWRDKALSEGELNTCSITI